MAYRSFSIRSSLVVIVLVSTLGTSAVTLASLRQSWSAADAISEIVNVAGRQALLASEIKHKIIECVELERSLILAAQTIDKERIAELLLRRISETDSTSEKLKSVINDSVRDEYESFVESWRYWKQHFASVQKVTGDNHSGHSISVLLRQSLERRHAFENKLSAFRATHNLGNEASRSVALIQRFAKRLDDSAEEQSLLLAQKALDIGSGPHTYIVRQIERYFSELVSQAPEHAASVAELKELFARYNAGQMLIFEFLREDEAQAQLAYSTYAGLPHIERARYFLSKIIVSSRDSIQTRKDKAADVFKRMRGLMLFGGVFSILLTMLVAIYFASGVLRQIRVLSSYFKRASKTGDLSVPVPHVGDNELGGVAAMFERVRWEVVQKEKQLKQVNSSLSTSLFELEQKSKELEQFVYTVSHDLKSPLVTCTGFVGIIREELGETGSNEVNDSIERIERACRHMHQIIDDLLVFSRLGRKGDTEEEVDVGRLVSDLKSRFEPLLSEKGIGLSVASGLPVLRARKTSLLRLFENLLSNAIQYGSTAAEPSIEIGSRQDNGTVQFFVKDNGKGIDPRYHSRIFTLFQRLEHNIEGTGLGLASVAKVAQLHGGKAWVESELGKGAVFWVSFPSERLVL